MSKLQCPKLVTAVFSFSPFSISTLCWLYSPWQTHPSCQDFSRSVSYSVSSRSVTASCARSRNHSTLPRKSFSNTQEAPFLRINFRILRSSWLCRTYSSFRDFSLYSSIGSIFIKICNLASVRTLLRISSLDFVSHSRPSYQCWSVKDSSSLSRLIRLPSVFSRKQSVLIPFSWRWSNSSCCFFSFFSEPWNSLRIRSPRDV